MLKRLPDEVRHEIIVEMNVAGPQFVNQILGRTPVRTGALRAGIKFKVFPRSLKLQLGVLGTIGQRRDLFYGRILEFGRKAQTVQVTRRGRPYSMRVRPIAAKRFVTGRMPDLRKRFGDNLRKIYERALKRASQGGA